VAAVDVQLRDRDEFLQQIRERLLLSQDAMKAQSDSKRRALEFAIGDWVWFRLHHRSTIGITPVKSSKLSPRFYGPYKVIEHIGNVAYHLQLPSKAKIHDVFHVALLKKFEGTPPEAVIPLPAIQHGRVLPKPDKVIKARLNRGVWEVLVSWQGQAPTDTTWEKIDDFKQEYPEVQLEDDLFLGEEGNVIDSFVGKFYHRRVVNRKVA
jgi:hypothetical protein